MSAAKLFLTKSFDLVFPSKCALCDRTGEPIICDRCYREFEVLDEHVVMLSGPLDYRLALFAYEGRVAQAVSRLKYAGCMALAQPMSDELAKKANEMDMLDDVIVVPVPIHWTRRWQRGFNQAEALCLQFAANNSTVKALKRIKPTSPQAGFKREERLDRMQGAFSSANVFDTRVLLVDDVITTGATAEACAGVLKAAGAKSVGLLAYGGAKSLK